MVIVTAAPSCILLAKRQIPRFQKSQMFNILVKIVNSISSNPTDLIWRLFLSDVCVHKPFKDDEVDGKGEKKISYLRSRTESKKDPKQFIASVNTTRIILTIIFEFWKYFLICIRSIITDEHEGSVSTCDGRCHGVSSCHYFCSGHLADRMGIQTLCWSRF